MTPQRPQQKQPVVTHAVHGDEVFFHKGGVPCSGKVLCSGKHGCTVEHEGKQHKLKWEHLAGHKKRAPQRYTVLEEGEDGMIVGSSAGARRFIAVPPEARQERLAFADAKKKPA